VGQEVAAVDRVVEMNLGRVPLPLRVDRAVDPALGADRVAPLDGHDGEEIDAHAHLGRADGRHQPREASTDDDDPRVAHRRRKAWMEATPRYESNTKPAAETYIIRRCACGPTVRPHTIEK